ncbi:MAG: bifunctional phosphoribosyl-AMP cyclohydrolase/phosphoribosyl-ATP diphosphatase HisIE [Candidatus Limnocylindrales bacterium]
MTLDPATVRFDAQGLVPAIVQDAVNGTVLMLAWMDREALDATLRTNEVHFHSRSRGMLWKKGETSGNVLHAVDVRADCDGDALLVRAHPAGPVCHTGTRTCWGDGEAVPLAKTLADLGALLAERKRELPAGSYTAELFRKGRGAIAQKVGEEALELALAAVAETPERALSEYTDLVYSLIVLATELGIGADDVDRSLAEKKVVAQRRAP